MMRMLRAALLLAALLCASPSLASTCTPNATNGNLWGPVGSTAWVGAAPCTTVPTNADTFNINTTRVTMTADVAVTTGQIEVATGGKLYVTPGNTLQFGQKLKVTGGDVRSEGALMGICSVVSQPDYTNATAVTHTYDLTLDCHSLAGIRAHPTDILQADFIRGHWPDVEDLDMTGKRVNRGPGHDPSADVNMQYAVGRWDPIDAVTAGSVTANLILTLDLNPNAANFVNTPYAGVRHVPTAGDPITMNDGAEVDSCVVDQFGQESVIQLDAAFNLVSVDDDMGSYFLQARGADPNIATDGYGVVRKVKKTRDGANDFLVIAGDVCKFVTADFDLTPVPYEPGDKVDLIRPAYFNGENTGDTLGDDGIEVYDGGFSARYTVFYRMGPVNVADHTPNYAREQHIAFSNGNSGGQVDRCEISDSAVLYANGTLVGGTQVADVAVIGLNGSNDSVWYDPNGGLFDAGVCRFDNLYIADSNRNGTVSSGGQHTIFAHGVKNLEVTRLHTARINDDGFAGAWIASAGTSLDLESAKCRGCLIWEFLPPSTTDNSVQGVEFQLQNVDLAGRGHSFIIHPPGWLTVEDSMVGSIQSQAWATFVQNQRMRRTAILGCDIGRGGSGASCFNMRMDNVGDASNEVPNPNNYNLVEDSVLDSTPAEANIFTSIDLSGKLHSSIITGNVLENIPNGVTSPFEVKESLIDIEGGEIQGGQFNFMVGVGSNNPTKSSTLLVQDSIFRSTLAREFTGSSTAILANGTANFRRNVMLSNNGGTTGPFQGFTAAGTILNVNGLLRTQDGTPTAGQLTVGSATATIHEVCYETTHTQPELVFPAGNRTVDNIAADDLAPDHDDGFIGLAALTDPDNTKPCGLPARVGLRRYGFGPAMLGNVDMDTLSSTPLIVETGGVGSDGVRK